MRLHEVIAAVKDLEEKLKKLYKARNILYNAHCYTIKALDSLNNDIDMTFVFKDKEIQNAVDDILEKQIAVLSQKLVALENKVNDALSGLEDLN
jgi:hypothetical protein